MGLILVWRLLSNRIYGRLFRTFRWKPIRWKQVCIFKSSSNRLVASSRRKDSTAILFGVCPISIIFVDAVWLLINELIPFYQKKKKKRENKKYYESSHSYELRVSLLVKNSIFLSLYLEWLSEILWFSISWNVNNLQDKCTYINWDVKILKLIIVSRVYWIEYFGVF